MTKAGGCEFSPKILLLQLYICQQVDTRPMHASVHYTSGFSASVGSKCVLFDIENYLFTFCRL